MGYMKRDGLPEDGRRSKMLQVRIGTAEYAVIQRACELKGISVSEYIRCAAAELAGQPAGRERRGAAERHAGRRAAVNRRRTRRDEKPSKPVWMYRRPGVGKPAIRHYNSREAAMDSAMGYLKQDGRPETGRRSKMLQVRIGTAEYTVIQRACGRKGMTVSEYVRCAAIEHAHRDGGEHSEQLRGAPVT